jgi:hypothetical protein
MTVRNDSADEVTTSAPSDSSQPELPQPAGDQTVQHRASHRAIIGVALTIILVVLMVIFVAYGPPSEAASGGCGGG